MATHSSTLTWKIPWMEEPGRLQSMGSLRVRHDWATSLSLFTFMHWKRKWQPTPVFLPGESQGQGSLVGCLYGVAQSQTRLKWLSSSSSSRNWGLRVAWQVSDGTKTWSWVPAPSLPPPGCSLDFWVWGLQHPYLGCGSGHPGLVGILCLITKWEPGVEMSLSSRRAKGWARDGGGGQMAWGTWAGIWGGLATSG